MAIGKDLEKKLSRKYPPSAKRDELSGAMTLQSLLIRAAMLYFCLLESEKSLEQLKVKDIQDEFLKVEGSEEVVKGHWDLKGKIS